VAPIVGNDTLEAVNQVNNGLERHGFEE